MEPDPKLSERRPTMIRFLPTPLPDETLYSIVARFFALCGYSNSKAALRELFGRDTVFPLSCVPGHLEAFARITGIRLSRLISENTAVPYFQPFLSTQTFELLLQRMRHNAGSAIKLGLGLPASRLGAAEPLRYCEECANSDIANYGTGYWHRAHQLPGVLVCPVHGSVLTVFDTAEIAARFALQLPLRLGPSNHLGYRRLFANSEIAALRNLSRDSTELLARNLSPIPPGNLSAIYMHAVARKGWMFGSRRIHPSQIIDHVSETLQALPQVSPFLDLKLQGDDNWAVRLLRAPRGTVHPLKHILLIRTLFDDFAQFVSETKRFHKKPIAASQSSVRGDCHSKRQSALIKSPPCVQDIHSRLESLLVRGDSVADISRAVGFSSASIYRFIQSHKSSHTRRCVSIFNRTRATKRQSVRHLIESAENLTRNALRRSNPGLYMWFYRNDRSWLWKKLKRMQHTQVGQRVNWQKRDMDLAARVQKIVRDLRNEAGRPCRLTQASIARRLNYIALDKNLDKLPKTAQILELNCESRETFRRHRVLWAVKELLTSEGHAALWSVSVVSQR